MRLARTRFFRDPNSGLGWLEDRERFMRPIEISSLTCLLLLAWGCGPEPTATMDHPPQDATDESGASSTDTRTDGVEDGVVEDTTSTAGPDPTGSSGGEPFGSDSETSDDGFTFIQLPDLGTVGTGYACDDPFAKLPPTQTCQDATAAEEASDEQRDAVTSAFYDRRTAGPRPGSRYFHAR